MFKTSQVRHDMFAQLEDLGLSRIPFESTAAEANAPTLRSRAPRTSVRPRAQPPGWEGVGFELGSRPALGLVLLWSKAGALS